MYHLLTRTSWQSETTSVDLTHIKELMTNYPLIERKFFDDIVALCRKQENYFVEMGLGRVMNPAKKDLNIDFWILIWGVDFKGRLFQLLFERHPDFGGRGALVGIGPIDLAEFFSKMKKNALLPLLTLLTTPEKMQSVGIIVSRPKSYKQSRQEKQKVQALTHFQNWINELKATPNTKGQWFPSFAPKCPVCNGPLVGLQDGYEIMYGHLICPQCGYTEKKKIF